MLAEKREGSGRKGGGRDSEVCVHIYQSQGDGLYTPVYTLCDIVLQYVDSFEYLGQIITTDFRDDEDVPREKRRL